MKLEAESLREFVELVRGGSRIEIRPKVLCLNSDSNAPLIMQPLTMQLQFIIEFSSNLLGKTLVYREVIADGVSVAIDTVCYTPEKIEIGELMNDLKNKAALRNEELTKLFQKRGDIEVVLYDLDGRTIKNYPTRGT